jgi:hypothetical protein
VVPLAVVDRLPRPTRAEPPDRDDDQQQREPEERESDPEGRIRDPLAGAGGVSPLAGRLVRPVVGS